MGLYVNARAIIERPGTAGTEVLIQRSQRPGLPPSLELPGGRLEEYESILEALAREVREETGLKVTQILDETDHIVTSSREADLECLRPFFVYQTIRGPVDSTGFFFRCHAEGELLAVGDAAVDHRWVTLQELEQAFQEEPEQFDWLTQGAINYYLRWHKKQQVG